MKLKELVRASESQSSRVEEMVYNTLLSRQALLKQMSDPRRDYYSELGYKETLTPNDYYQMWARSGIAQRVVKALSEECWRMEPQVYENEEAKDTDFDKEWKVQLKKHNFFHYLERVDTDSGIGSFGLLLIGLNDGRDLSTPVRSLDNEGEPTDKPAAKDPKITFLRVFHEKLVTVDSIEDNPRNPRFGQPKMYQVSLENEEGARDVASAKMKSQPLKIHWSRVIHVADNRLSSEIYGIPRMQPVYNYLQDIFKLLGGSAEMFWKGAFPGISFEVHPGLEDIEVDKDTMRDEMESYANGLQRYMALVGISAKSLAPQVADPKGHLECQLQAIAISLGIPLRVLLGTEAGELASSMDTQTWNSRIKRRQQRYLNPMLVEEFVRRLIAFGILPKPEQFTVFWPDLGIPTETEAADVINKLVDAMAKYIEAGVDQLIPEKEFLVHFMKHFVTQEMADKILEAAESKSTEKSVLSKFREKQAELNHPPKPDPGIMKRPGNKQPATKPVRPKKKAVA